MSDKKRIKVLLKAGHPHADEIGFVEANESGKVTLAYPSGGTLPMFEVKLENCKHGVETCYAVQKDCVLLGVES